MNHALSREVYYTYYSELKKLSIHLFKKQSETSQELTPNRLNYPHTHDESLVRETRRMDLFDEVDSLLHATIKSAKKQN